MDNLCRNTVTCHDHALGLGSEFDEIVVRQYEDIIILNKMKLLAVFGISIKDY